MKERKIPIVEMRGIDKKFPGVKALSNVSFTLFPGEIHGLMGENGAGKSTLIKLLTGVYKKDNGKIFIDGKETIVNSPLHAQELGISTVYQEINLCPNLSVAENIFIGRQPIKNNRINWQEINNGAIKLLKGFDLDIDVKESLSHYAIAIQQMVAIARAFDISAKVLILDEPTASLDKKEVNKLFEVMRKLKNDGIGIIFITHFIDHVYEVADRITVLRNAKLITTAKIKSLPKIELISKMIGKDLEILKNLPKEKNKEDKESVKTGYVQAKGLCKKGSISPFNLNINKGEVLGLAGLLGSGRTELVKLLFGLDRADKGEILINNEKIDMSSPEKAIEHGFAFCPEDRKSDGIIGDFTVKQNIILALQVSKGWYNFLSKNEQSKIANMYIKLLNISTPDAEQLASNLSGGNQQKLIIARWLAINPQLLILDEPTKGIDIGAKIEIQKLVLEQANKENKAVIFISSELDEVIRVSNCVAVLCDRKKIAELRNEEININNIMNKLAGR